MSRYAEDGIYARNTASAISCMTVEEAAVSFDCWWPACLPVAGEDGEGVRLAVAGVKGESAVLYVDADYFDVDRVAQGILANPDVIAVEVGTEQPRTLEAAGLRTCEDCGTVVPAGRVCGVCPGLGL